MTAQLDEDYIENLDDLLKGCDKMDELGIPGADDIESLSEVKAKLWAYLRKQQRRSQRRSITGPKVIQRILNVDKQKKRDLLDLCNQTAAFISKLPDERRDEVYAEYPEIKQLNDWKSKLTEEKCPVLVAGETSAGKSSFVNLLFGDNLLPVATLSSTSLICELTYGEERRARVFWRDEAKEPIEIALKDAEDVVLKLSPFIHQTGDDRDVESPYSRVVIDWPFDLLKAGIKIVDSPGIGESKLMTEQVINYMPQAYGFIYLINAANGGGVQQDRLEDLLFKHKAEKRLKEGRDTTLDIRSVMFVVNRWDQVEEADRPATKAHIIRQLKRIWRGIRTQQIFFISVTTASQAMEEDYVNDSLSRVLKGVEKLLPLSLRSKLEKTYFFMTDVLNNVSLTLARYMAMTEQTDKERNERCRRVADKLRELKDRPDKVLCELGQILQDELAAIEHKMRQFLTSPETTLKLTTWKYEQCPHRPKWNTTLKLMEAVIQKRIRDALDQWEKENDFFQAAHAKLVECFERNFYVVEEELNGIAHIMTAEAATAEKTHADPTMLHGMVASKASAQVRTNTYAKIGAAASTSISIPLGVIVGAMYARTRNFMKRWSDKRSLAEYENNREKVMCESSKAAIEALLQQLESLMTAAHELTAAVPKAIRANEALIGNIQREIKGQASMLHEVYKPLKVDCDALVSEFDYLYMQKIRIYFAEISEDDPLGCLIGDGSFGEVYATKLPVAQNGREHLCDVALKVMKRPLNPSNASQFLIEERNLRCLQSPNTIRYMGTTIQRSSHDQSIKPIIIMEYCQFNLRDVIFNSRKYTAPGSRRTQPHVFEKMQLVVARFGSDIAAALKVIHNLGYIHRDLKPENILMLHDTLDAPLKVADFGTTKASDNVAKSLVGTPSYIAPEVFKQEVYTSAADMYSFGVILWECWTGIRHVSHSGRNPMKPSAANLVFKAADFKPPPEPWQRLLFDCGKLNAAERPSAAVTFDLFNGEFKKLQQGQMRAAKTPLLHETPV